ncbi:MULTISPECIES: DUF4931 domain-containing protein [Bacillus cereus group]|uniref:DUF4931 domain-containing protein n=1 Tax=Bacillus cereus group TaxID=86661 RepID=UPI0022E903B5|nr:DUF4931 domain-containing protein [Bacillus cereus group sp. TH152-1LC]MDA1674662.1 DUF4931 domain-containing protein [Bacillus cereus group sp. TH152-1LC]
MNHKYDITLNTKIAKSKPNTVTNNDTVCPFCDDTKPQIIESGLMLEDRKKMFWAKNKFPLLEDTYQTLIVETNRCGESLATYTLEYATQLFKFIFECRDKLIQTGKYKEVIFFKNHGIHSDSSISHSHSQIIGLNKLSYDYQEIEDSIEGPTVYQNEKIRVTVSKIPRAEFYEFNVTWKKEDESYQYVEWVQTLIKYLSIFKGGKFNSYNLVFHETEAENIIKVIPRKPNSVYYIGFGIRQTPNDTEQIAKEIQEFTKK